MFKKIFDFIAPLLCEWDDKYQSYDMSLGRCAFWVTLVISVWKFWMLGNDIPANLLWLLGVLLTYNIGKHVPDVVKDIKLGNGGQTQDVGEGDSPK